MSETTPAPEELYRRLQVEREEEERKRPAQVEPHMALVRINIEPFFIPGRTADPQTIIESIREEFRAELDLATTLRGVQLPADSDINQVVRSVFDADGAIKFRGGFIKFDDGTVTAISYLSFGSQHLMTEVAGTSSEALFVCQRLGTLIWQAAGLTRSWHELEPAVELTSFATATIVDLPISEIALLAPEMRAFLDEDVAGANGFGSRMGTIGGTSKQTFSDRDVQVSINCREVDLRINVFDAVSGSHDECKLSVVTRTRSSANRGRVTISSELDSATHEKMVRRLLERLGTSDVSEH